MIPGPLLISGGVEDPGGCIGCISNPLFCPLNTMARHDEMVTNSDGGAQVPLLISGGVEDPGGCIDCICNLLLSTQYYGMHELSQDFATSFLKSMKHTSILQPPFSC